MPSVAPIFVKETTLKIKPKTKCNVYPYWRKGRKFKIVFSQVVNRYTPFEG